MPQVSGRCVDASGTPVPGAYVYAVPATGARFGKAPGTHSRRDGRWTLELSAGEWTVRETGHDAHAVQVGNSAVDLDVTVAPLTPQNPRDDLARLLERRRGRPGAPAPELREQEPDHTARDAYMAQVARESADATASRLTELMTRRRSIREET